MTYRSLSAVVADLESTGQLVRVDAEIDAHLEIAEIQRRLFAAGGPAVLFTNVRNCQFPMLANLYGTRSRAEYLFRDTFESLRRLIQIQGNPLELVRHPFRSAAMASSAWHALPRRVRRGPVLKCETTVDRLPKLVSWPDDGGAYITLPQVYTEDPVRPGLLRSNLGMYRVQISGGQYEPGSEVGLHYQIHRGIAIHHSNAIRQRRRLPVNVFVGGTPAMTLASVMPMPEGMSELLLAGILASHRIPMICRKGQLPIYADADFCLSGYLEADCQKTEGPFGDHLGYYSGAHDFPVMKVEKVFHRPGAIWPFTVVGRPPQEDTIFGQLIHDLVGPAISEKLPGVHAVHAVDAAGVHPLLLAIGSERYAPYDRNTIPAELLTQANAILGQGQLSLAKYLFIVDEHDDPTLDVNGVKRFLVHTLRRADWRRDLHFHTSTTADTLDYSDARLNRGSKLVVAACGHPIRELPTTITPEISVDRLGFSNPKVAFPGVLVVEGPSHDKAPESTGRWVESFGPDDPINQFPLIVVVDDTDFASDNLFNFLWTTFTRSDPASDIYGIHAELSNKHWGCRGSLVIDAREKSHHGRPLIEDPEVTWRVDQMAATGGPLHGLIQ
jgi:4-hydroxy-3-polyprenylbenzoate decarboxylase